VVFLTSSQLAVELCHELGGVAVTAGGTDGHGGVDAGKVGVVQHDRVRPGHRLDLADPAGADDGDDVLAAGGDPGDRELGQGDALGLSDLLQVVSSAVVVEVVALEATTLLLPLPEGPRRGRNMIWRWFIEPDRRPAPREDWDRMSASHVMDLRATYARRAGDSDITSLVHDLLATSEEFRGLWERHQVGVRRADLKTFVHPEVGPVAVRCEVLLTEEADVKLLAYFPAEGTSADSSPT